MAQGTLAPGINNAILRIRPVSCWAFAQCTCDAISCRIYAYLSLDSFSKCFIKLSLAVWWSTMVTLRLWYECSTAIFTSTTALSFHSDVGVRVSKFIFSATVCKAYEKSTHNYSEFNSSPIESKPTYALLLYIIIFYSSSDSLSNCGDVVANFRLQLMGFCGQNWLIPRLTSRPTATSCCQRLFYRPIAVTGHRPDNIYRFCCWP